MVVLRPAYTILESPILIGRRQINSESPIEVLSNILLFDNLLSYLELGLDERIFLQIDIE